MADTDQILKNIADQRQKLGQDIAELENRVRDATDWRVQFDRHPWLGLGLAMGSGLLLSAILPKRK